MKNPRFRHILAENTSKTYGFQWGLFSKWCVVNGKSYLPASSTTIIDYLLHREDEGDRWSTMLVRACALRSIHKEHGYSDPTADESVRTLLTRIRRDQADCPPPQAMGLTLECLNAIRRTTSPDSQHKLVTLALCSVMWDGLLRQSEAIALLWSDLKVKPDGSGRLLIRKSKNDPFGTGYVVFLGRQTVKDLEAIRGEETGRIFKMSTRSVARRIKAATRRAALPGNFSGHSPRVGMAQDLAANGASLVEMQQAGRWRRPEMPGIYTRNQAVERGAVAKFHRGRGA